MRVYVGTGLLVRVYVGTRLLVRVYVGTRLLVRVYVLSQFLLQAAVVGWNSSSDGLCDVAWQSVILGSIAY